MHIQMIDTALLQPLLEFAMFFIVICIRGILYLNPKKERAESEPRYCCRGQMLHNGLSPFTVAGMAVRDMDAVVYLAGVNAPSINLDQ